MSAIPTSASPNLLLPDNGQGETAHRFGGGLVGVLSLPEQMAESPAAVILFNAGLVHRVGPFRGYVQVARKLAAQGFPVLRFDQSGLGDSSQSTGPGSVAEKRLGELQAAMDLLTVKTGARRFVLGGICSGADLVFRLAEDRPEIVGVLLVDGPGYRTKGYWWRYLLPRVLNPSKLARWWQAWRAGAKEASGPISQDFRDFPELADARRMMGGLVARDARLLMIYTGGVSSYFNHRGQLAGYMGSIAKAQQVTLEYWPECDHTFYARQDRQRLQDTIVTWVNNEFAARKRA